MSFFELLVLAVGLSMDAFAIAVCKGFALRRATLKSAAIVGVYFGASQAIMPVIGYMLASRFAGTIEAVDHWVAFALLAIIGGKMVYEGIRGGDSDSNASLAFRVMLPLAIADSIDALAAGVSFAVLMLQITAVVLMIGATTFIFSAVGVYLGAKFGSKLGSRAEVIGGLILVAFGVKILLEHTILLGST